MTRLAVHAFPDEAGPAARLARALGVALSLVDTHTFPDGEIVTYVPPPQATTIVYRSLNRPNPKLVELMLAHDAWRRAGAERLILVAPYLCYMRQDAVDRPGAPISQTAVGSFLSRRFDRLITVDPHLHRTPSLDQALPGIETTCLSTSSAVAGWIAAQAADAVLVGPDAESRQWVERLALVDGRPWATLLKNRKGDRDVVVEGPAEVEGRPVALVDDVCSSGETLIAAARLLKARGAGPIEALVTHALFDASTADRLKQAGIEKIASTDSVVHPSNVVELAGLLAQSLESELAG